MRFAGLHTLTALTLSRSISMCIYCQTNKYRKIYENHYGPIPKDHDGRTFDIHHVDKDRGNNSPENLHALSIKDHYSIHYSQGDWMSCWKIGVKMRMSVTELSVLSKQRQRERVANGSHNFMRRKDGNSLASDRVKDGKHNLTKRADGTSLASDRVADGTHHLLGGKIQRKQLADGTHPFQKRSDGTSLSSDRVANDTSLFGKSGSDHPGYDHTVYELQNIKTGELLSGTQCGLGHKLGIKGNISKLVNNKRKTLKGWKLSFNPK